jgi:hypothetical protein
MNPCKSVVLKGFDPGNPGCELNQITTGLFPAAAPGLRKTTPQSRPKMSAVASQVNPRIPGIPRRGVRLLSPARRSAVWCGFMDEFDPRQSS